MTCPRCKSESEPRFMWDCEIEEKYTMCVLVCEKCDTELNEKYYAKKAGE